MRPKRDPSFLLSQSLIKKIRAGEAFLVLSFKVACHIKPLVVENPSLFCACLPNCNCMHAGVSKRGIPSARLISYFKFVISYIGW